MKTLEDFLFGLIVALLIFVVGVQCGIYSAHQRDSVNQISTKNP